MPLHRDSRSDVYYCDCDGGKRENVSYNLKDKTITCKDCGVVYQVEPHQGRCFNCRATFPKYAWYIPSGCPRCKRSFVD
jgi:predicted Zn-ribbon and HTH transcriptional regulator